MKLVRKIMAYVTAWLMVFTMSANAFATTVTNNTEHTYNVYQIFSGTQSETAGETNLGDIEWGTGINSVAFLDALKQDNRFKVNGANKFSAAESAADVATVLSGYATDSDFAKAFANVAVANVSTTIIATVSGNETTPNLTPGYYLFVDSSEPGESDAANSALLQITNSSTGLTIAKKYDVPELDKDIVENGNNVEAADKAIGDTVIYELTGTLPANYSDFETYKYVFHDTISKGQAITFNSFKVTIDTANGTDITSLFSNSLTANTDGSEEKEFTLTCNNLKVNTSINENSKIIVRYNATITKEAVVGYTGNRNDSYLEYSNNPNKTGEGQPTSKTPVDYTLVFTYELNPTKVDGADTNKKLPDAQFVLKATSGEHAGKYVQINAETKKVTGWLDNKPTALETVLTSGNTGVLVSGSKGLFGVSGLDSGTYELEEIKAPAGYNLADAITIVINADINTSEDNPELTSLKIVVDGEEKDADYHTTGILPMTVMNNSGAVLPSTGGIGTTIFYIVGGVMVAGAVVFLLTKRRMAGKE